MIDLTKDIESLSNFKRQTTKFLKRMKKTGDPVILTVNGKAELVVQDAASYQRLLELAEHVESLRFLQQSLHEVDAGKAVPMRKAIKNLGKKK